MVVCAAVFCQLVAAINPHRFHKPRNTRNTDRILLSVERDMLRFLERQSIGSTGLPESYPAAVTPLSRTALPSEQAELLKNQSVTYDGAMAAIGYLAAGQYSKAERILNLYQKEFYTAKGDTIGLYSSYYINRNDATLRSALENEYIAVGPALWVAAAALHHSAMTGSTRYLGLGIDVTRWAMGLHHFSLPDGRTGGVCLGYSDTDDMNNAYSTENNVNYYAVLKMLRDIYADGTPAAKREFRDRHLSIVAINRELSGLLDWISLVAYNPRECSFYRGYTANGPDTVKSLDTTTWAIAALGPDQLSQLNINPQSLLRYSERQFRVTNLINREAVEGFDEIAAGDHTTSYRMISFEGTARQVLAYRTMSADAEKQGEQQKAREYREKAEKYITELTKVSRLTGLYANALPLTTEYSKDESCLTRSQQGKAAHWTPSVSSTVWRYLAIKGFNPLVINKNYLSTQYAQPQHENNMLIAMRTR
jgi:hypothetical protein